MSITIPTEILDAIDRGAALVFSLSGGKDSQAMFYAVQEWLWDTGRHGQNAIYAVHADLGRAEWHQTTEIVKAHAASRGVPLTIVGRNVKDRGPEDLLDHIRARAAHLDGSAPFWPSAAARYCTSDLKRDPINKWLRSLPHDLIISVEGIRAEESSRRAKQPCFEPRKQITTKSREALTWRPVHDWTEEMVWECLGGRSGRHVHPAYALGNDRLSCSLCIFGSKGDLERGAWHNQEYANDLADLEEMYGYTFTESTSILDLCLTLNIRR